MTDIGKGDVVEARMDMSVSAHLVPYGFGGPGYQIAVGMRAIVEGLSPYRASMCPTCGLRDGPGILLEQYPLVQGVAWCPCEWRKVGPSRDEVVGWFAEHTKAKPVIDPEAMKRLLSPLRRL